MNFITITDYLLAPLYVILIYWVALSICNKYYPKGHSLRKYFLQALSLKMLGALFIGLIYQYYYGGGDTSNFFYHAKVINSAFSDSIFRWLKLLLHLADRNDGQYFYYISQMEWYDDKGTYMICQITAFIGIFTFNSYLPTSLIFAFLSFSGMWAMFRTFIGQYPHLTKPLAYAILFIPSCLIWGSGIFKDTICMFALGWMLYGVFQALIQRNVRISNILLLFVSFYILLVVKVYILISFLPAVALWILFYYSHQIKPKLIRVTTKLVVVSMALGGLAFVYTYFSSSLGKYSLDNIAKTSMVTRDWISYTSGDQGSAYDLGDFQPTLFGLLTKFPQAVNVTLFRPYLWEANKSLVFLNALESLMFLLATLYLIFSMGLSRIWKSISSDPNIQFCLIFSVVFAFAVGISTYNFGSLSRYKIPCLPLYASALVLIYYSNKPNQKVLH